MSELGDIIRQHLDDFYWEHVAPLEQQIIELGHKPKVSRPQAEGFRPDSYGAYNNRGVEKFSTDNYSGAIKDYTKAIELKPDYSSAYFNRGEAKRVSGSGGSMGAFDDFIEAYSLKRDDATYISKVAEALTNMGNLELAISFISEEIEAYPNYYSLYLERGSIKTINCSREYLSSKNKAEKRNCLLDVLSDINKAVEINPNDGEVYDSRAYAYYNLEMYTEACEDAKKAMNLGIIYRKAKLGAYCRKR